MPISSTMMIACFTSIFGRFALLCCALHIVSLHAAIYNSVQIKKSFYDAFELHLNEKSSNLSSVLAQIKEPNLRVDDLPYTKLASDCLKCRTAVYAIIQFYNVHHHDQGFLGTFESVLRELCSSLTAHTTSQCEGYASIYAPNVVFILANQPTRPADYEEGVCAVMLQSNGCGQGGQQISFDFALNIAEPKLTSSKKYDREYDQYNLTVLHLTDFHYDPLYSVGSPSVCTEHICCRNTSTPLATSNEVAGKWGDYNACDSPGHLIENICQQIASTHKNIDYVYYTGDFIDHFEWSTSSRQIVKDGIRFVTDVIRKTIPNKLFVPLIGNHDAYPSNLFAPMSLVDPQLGMQWLNDFIADEWKDLLPEEASTSLRKFGYFTMKVPSSGLRIISLNTNIINTMNMWIFYETESLHQQLLWLVSVLEEAERHGEYVHILAHIPPSSIYSLRAWGNAYEKVIKSFAHIISGQFFGHTHYDEWTVSFKDTPASSPALNVAWTAGSGTSFIGLNSNYRINYVDSRTFDILDHDTWIFNLTEANAAIDAPPRWFKEYSFREYYGVSSCSPDVLGPLVANDFFQNANLTTKYWISKFKQSQIFLKDGYNDELRYGLICEIFMCP